MEMKKPASRRVLKSQSVQLSSDQNWDTVKAQILQKISLAIPSETIDFDDYSIMFLIPRIVIKPGVPLTNLAEYTFMIDNAVKAKIPMVNLHVVQTGKMGGSDKENEGDETGEVQSKKKVGKVCICIILISWQHY
jgi:hypothetical protein